MEEWMRLICGLGGLMIGAVLLTYLTRGADRTPSYETDHFKKRDKKKQSLIDKVELPAQANAPT